MCDPPVVILVDQRTKCQAYLGHLHEASGEFFSTPDVLSMTAILYSRQVVQNTPQNNAMNFKGHFSHRAAFLACFHATMTRACATSIRVKMARGFRTPNILQQNEFWTVRQPEHSTAITGELAPIDGGDCIGMDQTSSPILMTAPPSTPCPSAETAPAGCARCPSPPRRSECRPW